MQYRVSWSIDVDADSPREAAEQAKKIMEDQVYIPDEVLPPIFQVYSEDGKTSVEVEL
jgi:hypothetical protein